MAQKYYNRKETAAILKVGEDDVTQMLERRELHGYRDGADWKFKAEDIDHLAKERAAQPAHEGEGGDVLLSEVALGQSDAGLSGTVIGMDAGRASPQSDVHLAGSDIKLGEEPKQPGTDKLRKEQIDSKVAKFEEMDLTLDEDLTLEDSTLSLDEPMAPGGSGGSGGSSGSAVDLSGRDLEDDDLVLGGSGAGSDVSIGGDSGISLVDPSDSGLSLEQPLGLGASSQESLELGEDDMIAVGAGSGVGSQVKTDDDFLLTPLEDAGEGDESESGSQVIALDSEGDESATMIAGGAGVSMAAMLDEDLSSQPISDLGMGAALAGAAILGPQVGGFAEGAALTQPGGALAEPPYTGWQIAGLVFCALLLMLCGMMMYDLLRNMWSWDGPFTVNSSIMDTVLGWFEK